MVRIFITCSSNFLSQANFFFSKLGRTEYDSLRWVEKQQDPSKAKSFFSRRSLLSLYHSIPKVLETLRDQLTDHDTK